jgi:hypothetical protein
MRRTLQRCALLALAGLALGPAGCSNHYVSEMRIPETGATLDGTVTYGNEKLMAAMVIAQGATGAATGFIGEDGHYRINNVPVGEVHVAVNTAAAKGAMMSQVMSQSHGKAKGPPKLIDVPAKYGDPIKSGITTTVSAGPNTFNVVIPK